MSTGKTWQELASKIGEMLKQNFRVHPELFPLLSAYANFEKKYVNGRKRIRNKECVRISKSKYSQMKATIRSQAEEIAALDYRIKTLLER